MLFAEAAETGILPDFTAINHEFADSLAVTARRYPADVPRRIAGCGLAGGGARRPEVMRDRPRRG